MKVRIQCAPGQLGMGECLKQIVAEHGLRGLYRGKNLTRDDPSTFRYGNTNCLCNTGMRNCLQREVMGRQQLVEK